MHSKSNETMTNQPLEIPFAPPRSKEIEEKMQRFTDSGKYAQDLYIDFDPEQHVYTVWSQESGVGSQKRLLPVSSLIAYFFEQFDAQAAAQRQLERYGIPIEESLKKWERIGKMACEVGTFVHEQTENYFRDGSFGTVYPFTFDGTTEQISVEKERQHFLHFVKDYDIHPYRQEWPVYDMELNIAGTIDMVCQMDDGELIIYDWKRSAKLVNTLGQPIVEAFGGRRSLNGISLPDTPFYHYCIQQNLYRYMLEAHYGVRVKEINLVVLCADYPTYFVVNVPKMDELIEQIIAVCHEKDLGHRLLVKSEE